MLTLVSAAAAAVCFFATRGGFAALEECRGDQPAARLACYAVTAWCAFLTLVFAAAVMCCVNGAVTVTPAG